MKEIIADFVTETLDSIDLVDAEIVRLEREPGNASAIEHIFRVVHTIKGTCGFLNLPRLERLAHAVEHALAPAREGAAPFTPDQVSRILTALDRIRFVTQAIGAAGREPVGGDDDVLSALGDPPTRQPVAHAGPAPFEAGSLVYQVLERPLRPGEASLDDLERAFRETPGPETAGEADKPDAAPVASAGAAPARASVRIGVDRLDRLMDVVSELVLVRNQLLELARQDGHGPFKHSLQRLSAITGELQDGVMRTRMQAISAAWGSLPRIVRDLARDLGKDILLQTEGDDTEIDRQLLEVIKDCLIHLVRNAADHGIEPPAERVAIDKPPRGVIRLEAAREGGQIALRVSDDGRGLDPEALKARALARGLISETEAARLDAADAARLIFRPGFSTAAAVTHVSGRGVGLDAVRAAVELAGGTIDLTNEPGRGLSVAVKLPLTLAIAHVLIVESGGRRFALPQLAINELVRANPDSDIRIESIGGAPALRLRRGLLPLLSLAGTLGLDSDVQASGLVAVCQAGHVRFALAVDAILQSEEVVVKPLAAKLRAIPYFSGATILGDGSVVLILEPSGFGRLVESSAGGAEDAESPTASDAEPLLSLLVFRGLDGREKAVPLSLVTRLEEIAGSAIESAGGHSVVQYGGRMMRLEHFDPARCAGDGPVPVVVFSHGRETVGVVVADIVDIVEDRLDIDLATALPGWLGSAIVGGRVMDVLDVAALFSGAQQALSPAGSGGASLVLLVEPSAFFQGMLTPLLRAAGHDVVVAQTVEAARELAATRRISCAIVDFDEGSGVAAFCAALRRDLVAPGAIIGLATRAGPGSLLPASAGPGPLIGKFDRRRLLDVLADALAPLELAA